MSGITGVSSKASSFDDIFLKPRQLFGKTFNFKDLTVTGFKAAGVAMVVLGAMLIVSVIQFKPIFVVYIVLILGTAALVAALGLGVFKLAQNLNRCSSFEEFIKQPIPYKF